MSRYDYKLAIYASRRRFEGLYDLYIIYFIGFYSFAKYNEGIPALKTSYRYYLVIF
jgi:hypothetical protein